MASNLLKIHIQSTNFANPNPILPFSLPKNKIASHSFPYNPSSLINFLPRRSQNLPKIPSFTLHSSLSSSTPPSSKEDAILQAKSCLSTALQKPLNNPKLTGKIKKQKQPRFRVEIPVMDDSPESITQLAFDIFGDLPLKRKGSSSSSSSVKILLIWPNPTTMASAIKAFQTLPIGLAEVAHIELTSVMTVDNRILNSADVGIFLAPSSSQLTVMKLVSDSLYPKPLVLFNPKWAFEEEESFGDFSGFVGSFDVIYAFLGLEVKRDIE